MDGRLYPMENKQVCLTCKHYYLDTTYLKSGIHECKVLSIKYLEAETFYCNKYVSKGENNGI
jgi:hypothetical protein